MDASNKTALSYALPIRVGLERDARQQWRAIAYTDFHSRNRLIYSFELEEFELDREFLVVFAFSYT